MTVGELKELLQEFKDNLEVRVEYTGYHEVEVSRNECFKVDDFNASNLATYFEFK